MNEKDYQLEALVRRARSVAAEIRSASEERAALLVRIDELTEVGWKMEVDGVVASKRVGNRSFDWREAYESLTGQERLSCLRTGLGMIDEKSVRAKVEEKGSVELFMKAPESATVKL